MANREARISGTQDIGKKEEEEEWPSQMEREQDMPEDRKWHKSHGNM